MNTETYVEDKLLDHIRLVCSSAHCTATKFDINGKKHLVHKTICQEPYVFKSRVQQWFMNPDFAELEIMDENGKCKKCGCSWTMHMATKYEAVEFKRSTDQEIEPEPEPKISYDLSPKPNIELSPNGDATVEVFNFNDPSILKNQKFLSRTGSKKVVKREGRELARVDEETLRVDGNLSRSGSKKSSKSEKSIKIDGDLSRRGSKQSSKSEKEPIKEEETLRVDGDLSRSGSKKSSKSEKSIKIDGDLSRRGSKQSSKSEKEPLKVEETLSRSGSKKSSKSEKSIKIDGDLSRRGSKQSSKSEKEPLKVEETLSRSGSKKSSKSEKSTKSDDSKKSDDKSKKSTKSDNSKKSSKHEEKPKEQIEVDIVEEKVEVPNNLNANITIEESKKDAAKKDKRPKTTDINSNDLPKSKEEKRAKTTEVRVEDLPKKNHLSVEEEKPKRRSIRFKTSAVDSNDLPKVEEKQELKTRYKTTAIDQLQLPSKNPVEPAPSSPKRRSIKFKLPTKEKTPTNKFDNNFNDQFDEIHEVLQTCVEDYAPSTKLLRFSDVIDFVDKSENEGEEDQEKSNADDASTVYANLDRNSRALEASPDRTRSNSPRKIGQVLDRPNFAATKPDDKTKSNGQVKTSKKDESQEKSKTDQGKLLTTKPKKPTRLRFGQNDELTVATSTAVTHNSKNKANKLKYVDNVKQLHPTISKQTCDDEDFCRELACEQESEIDRLIHVDEDTRSEKCRRWLVDNSLAPPPKRPEKFLQRLKRLVVNKGSQLKDQLVGRRRRANNE